MTEKQISDVTENRPQPAPVIDSDNPACDLMLFSEANKFAEAMIKKIPELHGIAIIPLWLPQLKDIPSGLLRLRNEAPPYIAALLQMLGNMSAFSADVNRDMMNQMRAFDQMARDLAAEVNNKIEQLKQINEKRGETEKAKE